MSDDWKLTPEEIDSLEAGLLVNKATTGDVPTFKQMQQAAVQMQRSYDQIRMSMAAKLQEYFELIGYESWLPVEEIAAELLNMGVPSDTEALAQNIRRAIQTLIMGYTTKAPYKGGPVNVEKLAPLINTNEFTVPAHMVARHDIGFSR